MNDTRIRAWLTRPDRDGVATADEPVMIVEFIGYAYAGIFAVIYSEETGKFSTTRLDRLVIR